VLSVVANDAVKHNLKKIVIKAAINTFMEVIKPEESPKLLTIYSARFFDQFLHPLMTNLPNDFVNAHFAKIFKFFKQTFSVAPAIPSIVTCFTAFVLHLDEDSMRPLLTNLCKWAMKTENVEKATIMCKVLNGLLEKLKELVLEFVVPICFEPVFLPLFTLLETHLCTKRLGAKRSATAAETKEHDSDQLYELLNTLSTTLELSFKHDSLSVI